MLDEQRGHARFVEADAHPVTGHTRLGDLEQRGADLEPVADAHLVVAEPVDREVLAELAILEIVAVEMLTPVPVRVELVHVHRALLAAVAGQVALPVARDVRRTDPARPVDGSLPDPGVHSTAPPRDVARQADVDRDEGAHGVRAPNSARAMVLVAITMVLTPGFRGSCGWRRERR